MRRVVERLQEFSIPLIGGVFAALIWVNVSPESYHTLVHSPVTRLWSPAAEASSAGGHIAGGHTPAAEHGPPVTSGWEHYLTLHFLANDLLMVLFFGIAAKEIVEACLPGGKLTPIRKAINPLFATVGGVLGPIAVFLGVNAIFGQADWIRGWGIPTATDIALAWLAARLLFGKSHPAVSFLLLLAIADDAIGLGIIAIGYPDPSHPTDWSQLLWLVPGIATAYGLRRFKVQNWIPYVALGGACCWWGLFMAGLHPALALVFIVPFLPGPRRDVGLFVELMDDDGTGHLVPHGSSPLEAFEHAVKSTVDWGLFFFAFANAGVTFSAVTGLTWIVLASMLIGKSVGITTSSLFAARLGFPLPDGMSIRDLLVASVVAALGLTVALFVSTQAFSGELQGAAKMGALLSVVAAGLAFGLNYVLRSNSAVTKGVECSDTDVRPDGISWDEMQHLLAAQKSHESIELGVTESEWDRFRSMVNIEL